MRHLLAVTALALSVFSITGIAAAAPTAGEVLAGSMMTTVDTGSAAVGQSVRLNNVRSESGDVSGGTLYGTVTRVVRAGQGRPAQLQMRFTRLVLPSGATYAVDGVVSGMQANTKNNTLKEAGGALAGMLVGNMLGKTIFHASGGGFLGAVGGFLVAKNNRQNMSVPKGTAVRVTLRSARRQASRY